MLLERPPGSCVKSLTHVGRIRDRYMNRWTNITRSMLKKALDRIGLVYLGREKQPVLSLLGLRSFDIRTVIDVGANKGQFAKYILGIFPDAELFCFEPLPAAFNQLNAWADTSKSKKIRVFNMAIGEREGTVEMHYHTDHSPSSSLLRTTELCESLYTVAQEQESITVPLTTLDNALEDFLYDMPRDILIKLDVQGYEDRVILGGQKTLVQARAIITEVSLKNLYEGQAEFNEIVNAIYALGFRYSGSLEQSYDSRGNVVFFDAVFQKVK